uniref:BTB domain-containing protein n=1 Tax=Oryzias sinensis TaxID=183150 RepID=A0A8C7Y9Q8_9TELE
SVCVWAFFLGGGGGNAVNTGKKKSLMFSSSDASVVQVSFPGAQTSVLDSLNRQREDGSLCDLSIHVQGQVFKAHRCVLAASSPYFHDQVSDLLSCGGV